MIVQPQFAIAMQSATSNMIELTWICNLIMVSSIYELFQNVERGILYCIFKKSSLIIGSLFVRE
jgi:hypothetical protein